ncbi:molybdopterin-binding protein [Flavobacterium alvei]|uniref:TOBE domain-containing protein n=1 Tax=Flavobacterium alvei TaxID=2080416 RepID=UPI0026F16459|nr:TOBE domain-containing protein [Flavobacterium alvei]
MNILTGIITQIQQSGAILLVDVDVNGQNFSALLIESVTRPDWLQKSKTIDLVFKETEVSLAKDLSGQISLRNRMQCKVIQVERGELLSKITMQFQQQIISSAITTRAVDSLQIAVGDSVEAMVKSNEISLMKTKKLT